MRGATTKDFSTLSFPFLLRCALSGTGDGGEHFYLFKMPRPVEELSSPLEFSPLHQFLMFRDCMETKWTEMGLPGAGAFVMNPRDLQESQVPSLCA